MTKGKESSTNAFTFLAPKGVTEMGKRRTMRLIRIRIEHWDTVEQFLRKPIRHIAQGQATRLKK